MATGWAPTPKNLDDTFSIEMKYVLERIARFLSERDEKDAIDFFLRYLNRYTLAVTTKDVDALAWIAEHQQLLKDAFETLLAIKNVLVAKLSKHIDAEMIASAEILSPGAEIKKAITTVKAITEQAKKPTARWLRTEEPLPWEKRVPSRFAAPEERKAARTEETKAAPNLEQARNAAENIAGTTNIRNAQKDADFLLGLPPNEAMKRQVILSGLAAYAEQYIRCWNEFNTLVEPAKAELGDLYDRAKGIVNWWKQIFSSLLIAGIIPPTQKLKELYVATGIRAAA